MEGRTLPRDTFMKLESQNINELIKRIAENELGETNVRRKESLLELKKLIERDPDLVSSDPDDFLLRFLRAKKFDPPKAFDLLKKYHSHRVDYPDLHCGRPPEYNRKIVEENFMNFLPLRTPDGCAVWAVRLGLWNPSSFKLEDVIRFGLLCHEEALKNPATQICGIVSVVDVQGLSWSQLLHISPNCIKGFISATQESFPIRHKAIHIINHPHIFSFLYALIKPLLNSKMRKRIHFHSNVKSLFEHLPPEMLPTVFGGTYGKFENHQFMESLLDS